MRNQASKEAFALAISAAPPLHVPHDAGPATPAEPSWPVNETLKLVADLARALDDQCRRARRQLEAQSTVSPDLRVALQAVATRAREAAERAPALLASRPAAPQAVSERANHPDTRECAVALALTMKLEGAAPADIETWLRDEFGREDAEGITAEAFGSK